MTRPDRDAAASAALLPRSFEKSPSTLPPSVCACETRGRNSREYESDKVSGERQKIYVKIMPFL